MIHSHIFSALFQLSACAPVAARNSLSSFFLFFHGLDETWKFDSYAWDDVVAGHYAGYRYISENVPDVGSRTPDAVMKLKNAGQMFFFGKVLIQQSLFFINLVFPYMDLILTF